MSPEQAEGRELDPRSDIFSSGVVYTRDTDTANIYLFEGVLPVLTGAR